VISFLLVESVPRGTILILIFFLSYLSNISLMKISLILVPVICIFFLNCNENNETYNFVEEGKASYYANLFIGRPTANGEVFSQDSLTAAHKILPFGTKVKVTNTVTGNSIEVVINDRGPFVRNRIIDLTRRGADSLGFLQHGIAKVKVEAYLEDEVFADSLQSIVLAK
jgi:rare lipoprotein A